MCLCNEMRLSSPFSSAYMERYSCSKRCGITKSLNNLEMHLRRQWMHTDGAANVIEVLAACMRDSWPEALYNLGSGSWLAWANDTVAHYAAIHCPRQRTTGPAVQPADIPPPQSATLRFHPVALKILFVSQSVEGSSWHKFYCLEISIVGVLFLILICWHTFF